MANGKNNYGFNVVGARGLPSLVSTPQIQPSRGLNIPVPAIRKERQSGRDTTRAALLGALSPSIAGAALKGLAQLPGLKNFIYEESKKSTGDKSTPAEVDLSGPITDPRLAELQQRRAELDRQYPSLELPETKTNFGNLLENILTYAPGLALGDELGTAQAFLGTAQSARKLSDTLRTTRAAAAADREKTRFTKLLELDQPFERAITNSSILTPQGNFQPFQREVLISPNKTTAYVLSRGEEAIDQVTSADGKSYVVPKGEYYINPEYVLSDDELPDPTFISVFEETTNAQADAIQDVIMVNGRKTPRLRVAVGDEYIDSNVLRQQGKNYLVKDQGLPDPDEVSLLNTKTGLYEIGHIDTILVDGVKRQRISVTVDGKRVDIDDPSLEDRNYVISNIRAESNKVESGRNTTALLKTFIDHSAQSDLVRTFVTVGENSLALLKKYDSEGKPDLTSTVGGVYGFLNGINREVSSFFRIADIRKNYGFQTKSASRVYDLSNRQAQLNEQATVLAESEGATAGEIETNRKERVANAEELARELRNLKTDKEVGPLSNFFGVDMNSTEFVDVIADRASLVASQIRLAYAAAAADGQTGTALSDADVTNFLISVGANQSDPKVIGRLISRMLRDSMAKVESGPFADFAGKTSNDRSFRNYLISVLGVSEDDLNKLSEEDLEEDERKGIFNSIEQQMQAKTVGYSNRNFQLSPDGKSVRYDSFEDKRKREREDLFRYLNYFDPIVGQAPTKSSLAVQPGQANRRGDE